MAVGGDIPAGNGQLADGATYDLRLLDASAAAWERSPALRAWYGELWAELAAASGAGSCRLEVGSGIGRARHFVPGLVTSDVVATPYVERAISAYAVDAAGPVWDAIFAVDVLHHLREPLLFLAAAGRGLRVGGRLVLAEPAATPLARLFYGLCHHEPCRPQAIRPPFVFEANDAVGGFANMGMAHGLFVTHCRAVSERLAGCGLAVHHLWYRDVAAYPLTGGYSRASRVPAGLVRGALAVERRLPQWLLRRCGLRMVVVLERVPAFD
jgi:SAM-dependent methyltransferase